VVARRKAQGGGRTGRPPKLGPEQIEVLVALVQKNPSLSLDDIVWSLREQTGLVVTAPTVQKYLREAGFARTRPSRERATGGVSTTGGATPGAEPSATAPYGYRRRHRDPGDEVRYPCGLTDSEWEQVRFLFDAPGRTGRPEKYPRRQMLDACIYVLRSGCSWRMLPKDFPPWSAVYKTFRRWQAQGLFEAMYDELRKLWRARQHRAPEPTGAVVDSQSVKTSPQGGPKGYDAGKKVKGRKRHVVTDTLGLLLAVVITAANVQDRDAVHPAVERAKQKVPGIQRLYADAGYAGAAARTLREQHGISVEIVRHPRNRNVGRWHGEQLPLLDVPSGFVVLPKRWVVERTLAWAERPRRMNRDHDRKLSVSAAWVWLTEGRMLLRRLTDPDLAQTA